MRVAYAAVRVVDTGLVTTTRHGPVQVLRDSAGTALYVAASCTPLWQMIARARAVRTLVHGRHHDLLIWVSTAAATALVGNDPPYTISGRLPDGAHVDRADVTIDDDGRWHIAGAILAPMLSLPRARRTVQRA